MVAFTDEWGYREELKADDRQFYAWYENTINILKETLKLVDDEEFERNGWSLEAEDKTYSDKVYVKNVEKRGKTFAFTTLLEVGNQTSIVYWRSNEILGGLVSSRDFVDVRCYRKIDNSFVIASGATDFSEMPPRKGCIRGENGFNLFKISPAKNGHSKITWLMSSDMKGMLPKAVVEKAMRYTMLDYAKQLRLVLAQIVNDRKQ